MGQAPDHSDSADAFASDLVDRLREGGLSWRLPRGELLLPGVFGFCRGVTRALAMLQRTVADHLADGRRLMLLGQIIHNPWVNETFRQQGVQLLARDDLVDLHHLLGPDDVAIIPAFGVPLDVQQQLEAIGCTVVDTSCGDVRRLWKWAERAAVDGYGIVIFGRATHDETVVTKSRLEAVGGRYVVIGDLPQAQQFHDLLISGDDAAFAEAFPASATNAPSLASFDRLAQVSQTTMLYDETVQVREVLQSAMIQRGVDGVEGRLLFEPTVCHATQDRQTAAIELCRSGLDLVIVVGGFGSSNTRHLYELARVHAPSWFVEDASAIRSDREILALDPTTGEAAVFADWMPQHTPLRIGVLAGASSPEVVIGNVLERLAELLS